MSTSGFMPHGMCFNWQPGVLLLHTISDGLIAASDFTIAAVLVYVIVRRRLDLPFVPTIAMFAAFIIACGLTHVASIVVIWQPLYWTQGWISAATAVLSVLTAATLVPLLPRLVAARSPKELEHLNGVLTAPPRAPPDAYREMTDQVAMLLADSTTDALTGTLNRRGFDSHLSAAVAKARRSTDPTSLHMIDIDDFKAYNDAFGHPAGDACLTATAAIIRSSCQRPGDVLARFGGEEFAVIVEGTDERGAGHLAERIRAAVAGLNIPHGSGAHFPILTVSVGVGTILEGAEMIPAVLLSRADQALYRAKGSGRNCVAMADSAER
jgi:diguanylate cyclase (GGDEF)-like protein